MKIRVIHKTRQDESGYIYVKFYLKREKAHIPTKVDCQLKDWDEVKCRVKSSDKFFRDKNLIIEQTLGRINEVFVKYRLRNRELTRSLFYKAYNKPNDFESFYEFCIEQQKKEAKKLEHSTIGTHGTVFDKLKKFRPELHFEEITEEFLVDFLCHLRKNYGNADSTAYKNMAILKKYVRLAIKAGYIEEDPFEDFPIKESESNPVYLTEDELNRLIKLYKGGDMDSNRYKTLQLFFFMCFGSQHIGDALQMDLEQIGDRDMGYIRQKTRNVKPKMIRVPVSEALRWAIGEIVGNRKKGLIFENMPSTQKMNEWLKILAKEAGINKEISHKTGRHTFATYFLSKTKDLNTLRGILGHSNIRETLIYAHILDSDRVEGVACFNSFV